MIILTPRSGSNQQGISYEQTNKGKCECKISYTPGYDFTVQSGQKPVIYL